MVLKDISHVVEQSGHGQNDRGRFEVIQALQEELCVGVALVCCPLQPVDGRVHVVGNAPPHEVQLAQHVLPKLISHLCRLGEVGHGLFLVLLHELAAQVFLAQTVGGVVTAVLSGSFQPADAFFDVVYLRIVREI